MQNFVFIFIAALLLSSCHAQSFLKASKALGQKQADKAGTLKGFTFHQMREKLLKEKQSGFLKKEFDTLFLLEKHSIESGVYYGKIWNSYDSLSYSYSNEKFHFTRGNLFTRYTSYLVSKWDTSGIRAEENNYSNMIPQYIIYASLIITKGSSYKIETLTFKEFFKVERDRFDAQ